VGNTTPHAADSSRAPVNPHGRGEHIMPKVLKSVETG